MIWPVGIAIGLTLAASSSALATGSAPDNLYSPDNDGSGSFKTPARVSFVNGYPLPSW
jgi:hypothetical protein